MSAPSERDVQALARRIAEAGGEEKTRLFRGTWWSDQLLGWAMAKGDFKTQLFRFVDVFPGCRDDDDVMRHLQEYFDGGVARRRRCGSAWASAGKVPFGAGVSAATARRNIHRMARQFIAGQTGRRGAAPTGGAVAGRAGVDRRPARREDADVGRGRPLRRAGRRGAGAAGRRPRRCGPAMPLLESDPWGPVPRVNISVKATALAPRFGPADPARRASRRPAARLRPLLLRAREVPATIHIDTEHDDVKDLTFELVRALGDEFPYGPALGCVVQAYRKDSYADLRDLVAWSKRAAAGPAPDPAGEGRLLGLRDRGGPGRGLAGARVRAEGRDRRQLRALRPPPGRERRRGPARRSPATTSAAWPTASPPPGPPASPTGRSSSRCSTGWPAPVHAALRSLGQRVRIYAPVGELVPGMAYLVRRLLENTSNESFLRHRFAEGKELRRARPAAEGQGPGPARCRARGPRSGRRPTRRTPGRSTTSRRPSCAASPPGPGSWRRWGRPRPGLGFEAPVVIGGKPVRSREEIVSVDPGAYGTVVCRSGRAGSAEVEAAVAAASAAGRRVAGPGLRRAGGGAVQGGGPPAGPEGRAGRAHGLRGRQADPGGRRRRGRGHRLLRVLRPGGAAPRGRRADPPGAGGDATPTATSPGGWASSSPPGTSRWPSPAGW